MLNKNNIDYLKNNLSFWDKIDKIQQDKIIQNTKYIKYQKGKKYI